MSKRRKGIRRSYLQVYDGEWYRIAMRGQRDQCCHCGLVHIVDYRKVGGRLEMRCWVDHRATAAVRRGFKFTREDE